MKTSQPQVTVSDDEREKLIRTVKRDQEISKHSLEQQLTKVGHYKFVRVLGKGSYGKVLLALHKLTGCQVAIKVLEKSYLCLSHRKKRVFQEIYILKKLRHTNFTRLFEVFESRNHLLIVMEYANSGDALALIKRNPYLCESEIKSIFHQLVQGVGHLHCRSIAHRDLKLENIMLVEDPKNASFKVKIGDFGISKIIKKGEPMNESCGTPAYLAPEIIQGIFYDAMKVDMWCLGIILYTLGCGVLPFRAKSLEDLHLKIIKAQIDFPEGKESNLSEDYKDLVRGLIKTNSKDRLTIPQVLSHPWLKNPDRQHQITSAKEMREYGRVLLEA